MTTTQTTIEVIAGPPRPDSFEHAGRTADPAERPERPFRAELERAERRGRPERPQHAAGRPEQKPAAAGVRPERPERLERPEGAAAKPEATRPEAAQPEPAASAEATEHELELPIESGAPAVPPAPLPADVPIVVATPALDPTVRSLDAAADLASAATTKPVSGDPNPDGAAPDAEAPEEPEVEARPQAARNPADAGGERDADAEGAAEQRRELSAPRRELERPAATRPERDAQEVRGAEKPITAETPGADGARRRGRRGEESEAPPAIDPARLAASLGAAKDPLRSPALAPHVRTIERGDHGRRGESREIEPEAERPAVERADPARAPLETSAARESRASAPIQGPAAERPGETPVRSELPPQRAPAIADAAARPQTQAAGQNADVAAERAGATAQSAPAAAPAAPVRVEAIFAQIRSHARGGARELNLRLDPPELGELQLKFVLRGDQLRVSVRASSAEVAAALKADLGGFHDTLRQAGIDVMSLDIDVASHGGQGSNGGRFGDLLDRGRAATGDGRAVPGQEVEARPPRERSAARELGRVDVWI